MDRKPYDVPPEASRFLRDQGFMYYATTVGVDAASAKVVVQRYLAKRLQLWGEWHRDSVTPWQWNAYDSVTRQVSPTFFDPVTAFAWAGVEGWPVAEDDCYVSDA